MRHGAINSADVLAESVRLTGGFHLSEDQVAVARLRKFPRTEHLWDLCKGRRVFRGPIFSRCQADGPAHGDPYVSGSDLLQADVRPAYYLSRSHHGSLLDELRLKEGMVLVTCSGMNLGDAIWTREDLDGLVATHDLIRIVPDEETCPPGYLQAFLLSRYGYAFIRKQIYGGNIKHIEPDHLREMPVARLDPSVEKRVHDLVLSASRGRTAFSRGVRDATSVLLGELGIDAAEEAWQESETSFTVNRSDLRTLRALNHDPRVESAFAIIRSAEHTTLGDICSNGTLSTGKRFRRIDAAPEFGVRLIGQKHGFWMRPIGRWISAAQAPDDIFVEDETVLIASAGTLGQRELYCRPIFVTGKWLQHVFTQHFLRVASGDSDFPGAYLFAYLRSEFAFRALRAMSTGSKQQEIHRDLVAEFPVPSLTREKRFEIAEMVREAFAERDAADASEDAAVALVERAIEEAS